MEVIATLGPIVTAAIEAVRRMLDPAERAPRWLWIALAFVLGEIVAYGADVAPALPVGDPDWARALTGLGIGAMAAFTYKAADLVSAKAKEIRGRVSRTGLP